MSIKSIDRAQYNPAPADTNRYIVIILIINFFYSAVVLGIKCPTQLVMTPNVG